MKGGTGGTAGEPQDNFNRERYACHAVAGEGGNHAKTFNEKQPGIFDADFTN